MHRSFSYCAKFLLPLMLFAATPLSSASAAGNLVSVGEYNADGVQVNLDTYTDGPQVVALIGMKGSGTSISFAFDQAEWPKLRNLWNAARAKSGGTYQTAGSLKEVGSTAQCVITLAGGPGVRMTIVDPTAGALTYVVQPSDQSDFESKLSQVGNAATIVN